MVTVASLGEEVSLSMLTKTLPNYIYEPDQFPAAFYRVRYPRITFAIFSSGKIMSYGGQRIEFVTSEFDKLLAMMSSTTMKPVPPRICMIVGTGKVDHQIDLEDVYPRLYNIIYEPEQFPGMIWRIHDNVIVLIFASGKLVISGVKSVIELRQTFQTAKKLLDELDNPRDDLRLTKLPTLHGRA